MRHRTKLTLARAAAKRSLAQITPQAVRELLISEGFQADFD